MLKIGCKVLVRFFRILVIEYISSERSISFNANSEPYFNWSFLDFPLTAFVCHALSKTSSSFRQPSAVCCEEGSTNTLIMTDTNNGILKMIINALALSQNVPREFAEAVKGIQTDDAGGLDDTSPNSSVFTPKLLHEQAVRVHQMTKRDPLLKSKMELCLRHGLPGIRKPPQRS